MSRSMRSIRNIRALTESLRAQRVNNKPIFDALAAAKAKVLADPSDENKRAYLDAINAARAASGPTGTQPLTMDEALAHLARQPR